MANAPTPYKAIEAELLEEMMTNDGENLQQLSVHEPVMLFFLRHFGCSFCREALAELAKKRKKIENAGIRLIFVHMSTYNIAEGYFKKYRLQNISHVSDPACNFYAAFGLVKGNFNQLLGLTNIIRGFESGALFSHGMAFNANVLGDALQMPGIFLIFKNEIRENYVHEKSSDKPDYDQLMQCCML
jgi:peroxiredoxin